MAHTQDFGIGRSERVIVTRESTSQFDELTLITKPTTTDTLSSALRYTKFGASYEQERKVRSDKRSTRSHVSMISGKKNITWNCEGYAIPFNDGTTTDMTEANGIYGWGPLLKMAFGTQTVVTDTTVTYSLSDAQAGLDVATIHRLVGDVYMEGLKSAWVEEFKLSVAGGEEPKLSFSGGAQDMVCTGFGRTSGSTSSGSATVALQVDSADESIYSFENGSIIAFVEGGVTKSNSGTGYQVTGGGGTATLTISPVTEEIIDTGSLVIPFLPTGSTWPNECLESTLQPINGIVGTLDIAVATPAAGYDETDIPITAFELTLKNNVKAVHNEAFRDTVRDIIPGYRDVTGSVSVILTKEQVKRLGHRKTAGFITNDIAVSLGGALGADGTITINLNQAEIMFSEVDIPEAEEAVFTLPFRALATTAGADEVSVVFY